MRAKSRVKASLWGIEDFQSSAALEYVALVRSSEEDDYYRDDSMTMEELVHSANEERRVDEAECWIGWNVQ